MQPFRIDPAGSVNQYKTYGLKAPLATHHRPASCAEVECGAYANGWVSQIDVSTELGAKQANYIRLQSGRHFTWTQTGSVVEFTFAAGQKCFQPHTVLLERDPLLYVRGGDWRGVTSPARVLNVPDWVDDFATHQDNIKSTLERG